MFQKGQNFQSAEINLSAMRAGYQIPHEIGNHRSVKIEESDRRFALLLALHHVLPSVVTIINR
jgi:hypothetical protein